MFIGHYAVALGAKKAAPKVSLGTFFLAAQLVDLLWPLFLLIEFEHVKIEPGNTALTPLNFYDYPITHSLLGAFIWSLSVGFIFYAMRSSVKNASIVSVVVFSHWVLDFVTHRPDLPSGWDQTTYFGLGLWNSVTGTVIVEVLLFTAGIILYLKTTAAKDRIGSYGFWALIGILTVIYFVNIFGPPPPSETAIAVAGNLGWLFVLWAYWIDRHRLTPPEKSTEVQQESDKAIP